MDLINRYVGAISLCAIAALSIFNAGYFWKIGLHFIGLVDLSNLVYSAALASVPIAVVLFGASWAIPKRPTPKKLIIAGAAGFIISMWGVVRFTPRTLEPQLLDHTAMLIGFAILGITALVWALQRYKATQHWDWRDTLMLSFFFVVIMGEAGQFTAAVELSDRFTYEVATKSGDVYRGVRILRSASGGFVLEIDRHLEFIPMAEIKDVKSEY